MVIHYTNIYNNVVFPGKKACIFRFKGRKSCANGDSVTLEFMIAVVLSEMMMKVSPVMPIEVTCFVLKLMAKMQHTVHHEANISLYN